MSTSDPDRQSLSQRLVGDWPDFLVVGAAKCGTTSLAHHLRAHPELFVPQRNEPSFFATVAAVAPEEPPADQASGHDLRTLDRNNWVHDQKKYLELFSPRPPGSVAGEVSPMYMAAKGCAEAIAQRCPNVRLIAVIRQPVDRAYSAFLHLRRDGLEPLDRFEDALQAEAERTQQGWGYLWRYQALSRYNERLETYFRLFGDQLKVVVYERYKQEPEAVLAELFEFLGVSPAVQSTKQLYNVSGEPRSQKVAALMRSQGMAKKVAKQLIPAAVRKRVGGSVRQWNLKRPELPQQLQQSLWSLFRTDAEQLSDRVGIDLLKWWTPGRDLR